MRKEDILELMKGYGISQLDSCREIDSSNGSDYRLNIIIDKKYVLRINNAVMSEERLCSISRLCERYRSMGILAPSLYKNADGRFLSACEGHVCYLSDYLDYDTADSLQAEGDRRTVQDEVLKSIGAFAARFTGVDLSDIRSMWSLIDLAPLDTDVDEKQENLDTLVRALRRTGEDELAGQVERFNAEKREKIKAVYKRLPRCVIQGDLNDANLLVSQGHFVGLIDFNMAGTEVNVNHFCCETNSGLEEDDFDTKSAQELYAEWIGEQERELGIILKEYELNELEKGVLADYRSICLISQYPNVMAYIELMKRDKPKALEIIRMILKR